MTVGQTVLDWMLCFAHFTVITLVSMFKAALRGTIVIQGHDAPDCDETLMILPVRCLIIMGTSACARR
jgi:hypothetical protein